MQKKLQLLQEVKTDMQHVDERLVRQCRTEQEAMRLCIRVSRVFRSQESIAESLGMKKGSLNTILNSDQSDRRRHMSRVDQVELQRLCGNRAVDQWARLYEQGLLNHQLTKAQRKAELLEELHALETA